jgi:hypothetical protein
VLVWVLLAVPMLAWAHGQEEGDLPVTHFPGGGPAATDFLVVLWAVAPHAGDRAKGIACHDGDPACDRDRLVNGRCQFWVRACLANNDARCAAGEGVSEVGVEDAATDTDLTILSRTLEQVPLPVVAPDTCGALVTLTVPLRTRKNGTPRKAKKVVALHATSTRGTEDVDAVKFTCKPPAKEKRKHGVSFASIQRSVFGKQCAFSGCHSLDSHQAGLALEGPDVYDALVDVLATTSAAQFAGKKRVVPGAPSTSFLMDKLLGTLVPGEGDPMPLGRSALPAGDIEAVRKWILAGAPRTGSIGGGLTGELDEQPRIPPPAVPAGGFRAHLDPVPLGDAPEIEGCQYVRLDNPEPIAVRAWELFMHEGSHHFILRAARCLDPDGDGVTTCDDPTFDDRFPTGFRPCEEFGYDFGFVVGAQTPHLRVDYQTEATGVALELARHQPLLLNSHYTNPFKDTLAEVWVNVEPVDPLLVRHRARILFSQVANAFLKVPPATRSTAATWYACAFSTPNAICDLSGEPVPDPSQTHFALLGITSHMHKRAVKFTSDLYQGGARLSRGADDMTDRDDGSKHLYVSTDYTDPVNLTFWPPIVVEQGDELRYTCTNDNGVTRPVRLGCEEMPGVVPGKSIVELLGGTGGASRFCKSDADCAGFGTGRCVPANLVFGFLAEDDMCIEPGLYYDCPGDAASCTD